MAPLNCATKSIGPCFLLSNALNTLRLPSRLLCTDEKFAKLLGKCATDNLIICMNILDYFCVLKLLLFYLDFFMFLLKCICLNMISFVLQKAKIFGLKILTMHSF